MANLGQVTRIVLPAAMMMGGIGNTLNLIILTRPKLKKHPSTHYFLAMSINNLFGSIFIPINDLLRFGYDINMNLMFRGACKLIRYFNDLCPMLSLYFIVLATMDRYFNSSLDKNQRKWSTVKMARRFILGLVIFFIIFYINTLVMIDMDAHAQINCVITCQTIYRQIYPLVQVILYTIIGPFLIIFFSALTICNTYRVRTHARPIVTHRCTEKQLGCMLFVQVGSHMVLNLPISILYLLFYLFPQQKITAQWNYAFVFSRHIYQFSYATPFFLYIITGHMFKQELVCLLKKAKMCFFKQRIIYNAVPNHIHAQNQQT